MILTGPEIAREVDAGRIVIDPFTRTQLNPNSYNFRLGRFLRTYTADVLDARLENPWEEREIPATGYRLAAGRLYLGHTVEVLGSDHYAPTFAARSSVARLGLFINLSASLGDIGFVGQWTLQLAPTVDVVVYPEMRIGQMMWWCPKGKVDLYDGKYQNSIGPQSTLIFRDFDDLSHAAPPGAAGVSGGREGGRTVSDHDRCYRAEGVRPAGRMD
jgi:deoxycytidine triphosphate deaminase